ncbi:MAG: hypothetical protein CSYNP_03353 [Syntrophus sp. SKADARSKE-3]|nr:hypothetical protein [Syntrophus sp. SKADARSKE-3]
MVIFYSAKEEKAGERLLEIVKMIVHEEDTMICRDIDTLSNILHQTRTAEAIAMLYTSRNSELQNILSLHELLWNMKLILVLPDDNADTVAKGHSLHPRFLSYSDSNFDDIAAVLKRMLRNLDVNH